MNASDVLIETLLDWGVGSVFGLQVRNEESAPLNVARRHHCCSVVPAPCRQ